MLSQQNVLRENRTNHGSVCGDMLVKSKKATDHIAHLDEMFHVLCKFRMKLNPLKCSFDVLYGIEANPV